MLFFVFLALTAYAVSLVASTPARFAADRIALPRQIIDVSGTVWNGQAIIEGGYELGWSARLLQSVLRGAFFAHWTLDGADTRLSGDAALRRASAVLSDVEGRAGFGLIGVAAGDLPVTCDGTIAVTLSRVALSRDRQAASGALRSGAMTCTNGLVTPARAIDAPALSAISSIVDDGTRVVLSAVADPATPLAEVSIMNRVLGVTVYPAGAALTQSLPTSGPITVEYPF